MTDHAQFIRDAVGAPHGYDNEVRQLAAAYQRRDEAIVAAGVRLGANRDQVQRVLYEATAPAQAAVPHDRVFAGPQQREETRANPAHQANDRLGRLEGRVDQLVRLAEREFGPLNV